MANLGSSRLSLEVLLTAIFVTTTLVYSFLWWRDAAVPGRMAAGITAGCTGLAAVVSSSSIYLVPAQPAWNSGWLPLSFVATVLVFAGISSATLLQPDDARFLRILLGLGITGAFALFVSAVWLIANVARRPPDLYTAARLAHGMEAVASDHVLWFAVYICLAIFVPITFSVRIWPGDQPVTHAAPIIRHGVFLATLSGIGIGRSLMYSLMAQ
jgi:anaerobic dimethyl sulfoxide reductase subunit C (anchor subunit)